ncbi:hypothetical protein JG688_00017579 [Phytophthora aleatoria]|uniref:Amino acid transporter transmembrane domain-containing protein n=1 Tax=Phytophthora aleatoria TaxID=2496075 RepID=A0A8J5LYF9_9STRA|nr:hypothetical protein JG688_00017579 [Phytophthora aleatoria]
MAFVTMEDAKASFKLFCCVYGIGTLSFSGNFSRAGPVLGIIGMPFMTFASIYGATSIYRVMLLEGAGAAFAGCMGILVADALGIGILMHGMRGHPSAPTPELNSNQVIRAFGSLAIAYGSGVVIPTAYAAVGCQISGNILWTIYQDSVHITIAFSVILNIVFYLTERMMLGMDKRPAADVKNNLPGRYHGEAIAEAAEYRGANAAKHITLRLVMIMILVILSVIFKYHFPALSDYAGASCITMNSIILPIVFVLKKKWSVLPMWEKLSGLAVIAVYLCLGCYVTVIAGDELFTPIDEDIEFPYCTREYGNTVYYNYIAAHNG